MTTEFYRHIFRKRLKYQISWKIHPVGAELFHADGRTDGQTERWTEITKLMVAFRNFWESTSKKKERSLYKSSRKKKLANQTFKTLSMNFVSWVAPIPIYIFLYIPTPLRIIILTHLLLVPCSGIRGTYKHGEIDLFTNKCPSKQNLI
jgi:hypothetical protein